MRVSLMLKLGYVSYIELAQIYKTDSNRFFAYHRIKSDSFVFFHKFVIVRFQLKFYTFLNIKLLK